MESERPFIRESEILKPIQGLRETPYCTLYKDGKEFRMRSDAFHLPRYLARGFTMEPPKRIEESTTPLVEKRPRGRPVGTLRGRGKNICPHCSKGFKNLGNHILLAHNSNNGG